jgi:hypothetical protein
MKESVSALRLIVVMNYRFVATCCIGPEAATPGPIERLGLVVECISSLLHYGVAFFGGVIPCREYSRHSSHIGLKAFGTFMTSSRDCLKRFIINRNIVFVHDSLQWDSR